MTSVLINLTLFKAGWLACVLGAAAGAPLLGVAAVAVAVAVHLVLARNARGESVLLLLAAVLGISWESALVWMGVLSYDTGHVLPGLAPYWIVAMWVLFATTLNSGMRWLRKSLPLAALAGAVGGPMSFFAGHKAGAVTFADTGIALLLIGAGWALLLPLLVRAAASLDAIEPRRSRLRVQVLRGES